MFNDKFVSTQCIFFHYCILVSLYVLTTSCCNFESNEKKGYRFAVVVQEAFRTILDYVCLILNKNSSGECVAVPNPLRCMLCGIFIFPTVALPFNVMLQDKFQYLHLYKYINILMLFAHTD